MKKTKIIATLGPAAESKEILKKLFQNGVNICRLNFSHGDHEEQLRRINLVKEVRKEMNLPIALLLDTKGPEIRTGIFENDCAILTSGQEFTLTTKEMVGNNDICYITYENLVNDVTVGDIILLDDGMIELRVKEIDHDVIRCLVINGGIISNKRGVNVPNVKIKLPPITQKDKEDILFGIKHEVDFIAASFVRSADAVRQIRKILDEHNSDIQIIAKIENQEGVDNIDEIIETSNGIMVARGDLGVEIPTEQVPFIQKSIIKKCNDASRPVITATQMLDSMMRNPVPTRAEVTDVANAIYDGTDAIMLSGETAAGKFPIEAVKTMVKIALETESRLDYKQILKLKNEANSTNVARAVSYSSCSTALSLNAKAIITSSMTGFTARMVSSYRPEAQIIGITALESVRRKMQLFWGVLPILTEQFNSTDDLLIRAVEETKKAEVVHEGDIVVITAGLPTGGEGVYTNMMKIETVK
ncbi:MAG: pyk [Clostridiales bacterium]|nr:pyk [Clostridiales bacterium]